MAVNEHRPSSLARRLTTLVGLSASLLIVVALNILGHRFAWRTDVTSTGSLSPSPRTLAVIEALPEDSEIVLAASIASPGRDRAAMVRVLDMLGELGRVSPRLRTTLIDTSTAGGQAQFEALIERLAQERAQETDLAVNSARAGVASLESLAAQMQSWAESVQSLPALRTPEAGGVNPWTTPMTQQASLLRVTAGRVAEVSAAVESLLAQRLGETPVPDVAQSRRILTESFAAIRSLCENTAADLQQRALDDRLSAEGLALTQSLVRSIASDLDASALSIDAATSGPLPVLSRVAQALASGEAAIVLGPGGQLGAITIDQLVPPPTPGAARPDAGRQAETLLVSALESTVRTGPRARVVVVHAGEVPLLGESRALTQLLQRTSVAGFEWLEWRIATSREMPVDVALAANEPGTVFVVIGLSTTAAGGPERAILTGTVLSELLAAGHSVLVNLAPSTLPGVGEPDPIAAALDPYGLKADTGRPTLTERPIGGQRFVEWEHAIVPEESGHPLADVVRGRTLRLTWPVMIERTESDAQAWALVHPVEDAWRESEWVGYWLTRDTDRPGIANAPAPGSPRDAPAGEGSLAWAVEIAREGSPQRLVVVGSHLWLFDMVARRTANIEGSLVETNPGNTELALAALEWLSGHDDMIVRTSEASAFPIVQPMGPARASALRWFFLGGLPMLVLIAGALTRLALG